MSLNERNNRQARYGYLVVVVVVVVATRLESLFLITL